ncbi:NAD(P)-dependent oxidoreductase [Mycobacterium sp. CVI_P3]|uniref:NAD(P)-dependent oxidoreductase n=1 Tax=Mycobacterium pinniadriaticum TaxID=2994102 RepID=A0ABT3S7A0_9MYCO|nr:NAD(P)-dependent oxidoreductase [Mycobacterium pinniadriaticum]MCX2928901.1 NAD(P)-dependent oxidoreductase [Mycobacterium pinniadriaticum]MCX2935232.1 NAD(P)-dependent oxidoreductase [Mycobacterium pinniadriaticum]
MPVKRVGVIGLGNMGVGMAANLIRAGHEVTVYNRSRAKVDALVAEGARPADRVAEACTGDVVLTMLADDDAVAGLAFGDEGIIASTAPDTVHISSSTISVGLAKHLTEAHAAAGRGFVSAPVFGRPEAAASAALFVVAAGPAECVDLAMPAFAAIGQRTFVISEDPPAANLKLSGNFLIGSVIESLGEAMALVDRGGVDKHQYLDTSTLFSAPVYRTYGALIAGGQFEPAGFAAPLGHKDIGLVLAAAEELRVPLPIASLLRDRFLRLLAGGGDHLDWSAVGGLAARDAAASDHSA